MEDYDAKVLEQAADAVSRIDMQYRKADINGKLELKSNRDAAFEAYSQARLKLLAEGMICTPQDVVRMGEIRAAIGRARQTQSLIVASGKLAMFLAQL